MKKFLIIVAGGSGTRMQREVPKQFIELCGKPILIHTIEAFEKATTWSEIIVVLPEEHFNLWKELCLKYNFYVAHKICRGGKMRFNSVKNGLDEIHEDGIVAIHDAVRPLVSTNVIINCLEAAEQHGSAIPVVSIKDSIRIIEGDKSFAHNREKYKSVQTPQCFRSDIIKKAYDCEYDNLFTDDASVVEKQNFNVLLVDGNDENIKITTPYDLVVAEAIIRSKSINGS